MPASRLSGHFGLLRRGAFAALPLELGAGIVPASRLSGYFGLLRLGSFRGVAARAWGRHRAGFTPERSLWPAQAWGLSRRCRSSLVFSQGPASWPASRLSSDRGRRVSAKDRWRCRGHSSRVRKGVCSRLPSDREHTRVAVRCYFAERFAASLPSPCVSSGARAEACRFSR